MITAVRQNLGETKRGAIAPRVEVDGTPERGLGFSEFAVCPQLVTCGCEAVGAMLTGVKERKARMTAKITRIICRTRRIGPLDLYAGR